MRTFLLKMAVALCIATGLHVIAAYRADGRTDPFYLRLANDRQSSLIIGTSRAAQGLKPDILSAALPPAAGHPLLFNYAFTVDHSPFGPTYLNAIEGKLTKTAGTNGLFIVAVDPWSLSTERGTRHLREADFPLHGQIMFNGRPNYEYLARNYPSGWGSLIAGPKHAPDTTMVLHKNGWLEIRVPMDAASISERTGSKVRDYARKASASEPSALRVAYLRRTLELLHDRGRMVLVRIPICHALERLENSYWPGFTSLMQQIAEEHHITYIDMMPERERFTYTDGNHLDSISAARLSVDLAHRINLGPSPR